MALTVTTKAEAMELAESAIKQADAIAKNETALQQSYAGAQAAVGVAWLEFADRLDA